MPPRQAGVLSQTVIRQPVGPVAAFTPWNFPVNLPSRKLGGALAAGCSVIIKPAEETPASCMLLVEAFHDAGLPPGVINMVCGEPAAISTALIASAPIRKVSFTGSIAVGKMLGELAARGMKRYTAELGGHAPVIVCADADIESAVKLAVAAKFRNAGQGLRVADPFPDPRIPSRGISRPIRRPRRGAQSLAPGSTRAATWGR